MKRTTSLLRLVCMTIVLMVVGSRVHAGGGSLCCPADVDGDGSVGATDLAAVLGAWGPVRGGNAADVDDSGAVDATDLAQLLGNWGECATPCLKTLVAGHVALADGTPVSDAVLVTDLGGKGVSGLDGSFKFEVDLTEQTTSLTLTAVASIGGTTFSGTKRVSPVVFGGVSDAGLVAIVAGAPCDPTWLPTFGGAPGTSAPISAAAIFDDGRGGGPALFVSGNFTHAGGVAVNGIAKWDGSEWTPLSGGVSGVTALAVFDDGSGPALFAGGFFTSAGGLPANRIAKWDGVTWTPLGDGLTGGGGANLVGVNALAVCDDGLGEGPALYVGGNFTAAGGSPASRIAKWNGTTWSPLGSGVNAPVNALCVFDDGSGAGSSLYAGGEFTSAGGVPADRIVRWNGSTWAPLVSNSGFSFAAEVNALGIWEGGSGPALIIGGEFSLYPGDSFLAAYGCPDR